MIESKTTYTGVLYSWGYRLLIGGLFGFLLLGENSPYTWSIFWSSVAFMGALLMRVYLVERRLINRLKSIRIQAAGNRFKLEGVTPPNKTQLFSDAIPGKYGMFAFLCEGNGWRYGEHKKSIYQNLRSGSVKTKEVFHSVLEIDLPRTLPNMLFDSPRSHGLQYLPIIDRSQRTSLEGDFDTHFVTYFPKHYHIDARSIISPEVMAAMIDSGVHDIEIHGDKLYLYSALIPADSLRTYIDKGLAIKDSLADHVTAYRDERIQDATNRQDIAFIGETLLRKKESLWSFALPIGYMCFILYISYRDDGQIGMAEIIWFGLMMLMLWFFLHIALLRRKKIDEAHKQVHEYRHGDPKPR